MLGTARALRETTALPEDIHGYQRAQINGDRFYITAMFERRKLPAEFVLGNGKTYGGYENVPLKPGTRYKVYVRGVTERDGKWLYGEPAAIVLPKTDESPVVKEGDNMDGVIAGLLGALILILIAIVAFYLYQRSNRPPNASLKVESQKKEFELRRFNARVTAVESDQTQENLTLVPVSVTTQLTVSESNDHRGPETNETTLVYEEIDLFSPGMMVLSGSGQTSEYTQVSGPCSHIYAPLEKREEEEHEYVNQIKPPEYINTYMPLIKGDNPTLLADNSPGYASLLKCEKRSWRR
ncbi:receptor-type tyrosine-protein phosphatase S-like [Stylophora pistillata]|uniref:receptor-type tyrosine-protein phosphatase S-like n=1 Tax=Stylophora pistillata TaxID=50429 RepID=UPI000C03DF50|nr:receptor-type tyrosine-protein phosphatase S-like [Stylophora pistillata]